LKSIDSWDLFLDSFFRCGGAGNRTRVQSGDQDAFYVRRTLSFLIWSTSRSKHRSNQVTVFNIMYATKTWHEFVKWRPLRTHKQSAGGRLP